MSLFAGIHTGHRMNDRRSPCGAIPRTLCLSLTIGMFAAALPGPAAADLVHVRYSLSLIGLPLGTAGITATVESNTYHVEADAKLTGLASLITSAKGAASASGAISLGRIIPATYATTSANAKMTRTVRMGMTAGTVRAVEISPPILDVAPDRVPVTDADKRNIIDPLSAIVMPVPSGQIPLGPAACNRSIPVFDGDSRFDIVMSYVGTKEVKAKGYAGPVSVCAVRYVPVAGYRRNRKATQYMANNKQIEVWLAPVQNAHVAVPFRISVLTLLGTTVIEAEEFQVEPSEKAASAAH
jgi:hypothetical protein